MSRLEKDRMVFETQTQFGVPTDDEFARVEVVAQAEQTHGYWSPSGEMGTLVLYIHEPTGLVTSDPHGFQSWMKGLVSR